ncbi:hypothetical protein ACTLNA_005229 [Escherichia coli]|nr:hypothetical protein [Escherichia coli]
MTYNITIGNKTIEITESGYNILKAILDIEFSPPTVVSFCSLAPIIIFWDLTLSIIV